MYKCMCGTKVAFVRTDVLGLTAFKWQITSFREHWWM